MPQPTPSPTPRPATAPAPPASVRVLVADVPDLDELVADATRRAAALEQAVELVEPPVPDDDHGARALLDQRMDRALQVARTSAPGTPVRIARRPAVPHPRSPYADRPTRESA